MSDGKEVKPNIHVHHQSGRAFVLASDHDRIVAELRAEVKALKEVIQHDVDKVEAAYSETIATQARKLDLARVLYHAAIKMIDRYSKEKFPLNQTHTVENVMDRYDQELAAIEKEEET